MKEEKFVMRVLRSGGIGVMPTDTVYGLVGSALSKKAVERIYRVRKREKNKPFIVLISSLGDLKKFGVKLTPRLKSFLNKVWPGPVSVILPVCHKSAVICHKFKYLHRGTNSIAFRLPNDKKLTGLIHKTGPLVAPSANLAGKPPARTVAEARRYFGDKVDPVRNRARASRARKVLGRAISNGVDFYIGGGRRTGLPSTLVEVKR